MLYAMFTMVMLTFIIGLLTVTVRVISMKKGEISPRYFKLNSGQDVPDIVTKVSNNFNNQFQVPMLFYVAGVLSLSLNLVTDFAIVCAWCFVALRIAHAYIHVTYNHVLHRLFTFIGSFLSVIALWVHLLLNLP